MNEYDPARVRRRVLFTLLLIPAVLVGGEIFARFWVKRYTPERLAQLTTESTVRGRFACYPYLPYVLNPNFPGHNSLGFRGGEFTEKKPAGVRRIACIGASTTYGGQQDATDSYPANLEKLFAANAPSGGKWEVINAGILGEMAHEILINLELRVLPLDPDVVVILPSRNEVCAQVYNDFKPDYTHFRKVGFTFTTSNAVHKRLFNISNLFMLACTVHGGSRFGWSEEEEHPLYAGIDWKNKPTPEEGIRNARDPEHMLPMRRAYENMLNLLRSRGIPTLMCMMPEDPSKFEKFPLDELPHDMALHAEIGRLTERDNDCIREIANRFNVPVLEAKALDAHPELFDDDCHLSPEGHRFQAKMVYDALQPLLGSL
jgi:lysophospholipase L1-like esterase